MDCSSLNYLLALACLAAWPGCATVPEQSNRPEIGVPAAWTTIASDHGAPQAWLNDFNSAALNRMVQEALNNNADIRIAVARVSQSTAEAAIVGADSLPVADLGLAGKRQKINNFGPQSIDAVRFENYAFNLNISWELDLWGRLRNRSSAALAQLEASQAELEGARLSLAAQVSKRWFDYIEARQQLQLAKNTAQNYRDNTAALEARFNRGLVEGLDLRRIRTQSAGADADVQRRHRILDQATRRLEVLLGRYPAAQLPAADVLPALPACIPVGLPSDLIQRRPDLVAAERRLAASDQAWSASRKDLLPAIRLTSSGGSASQDFSDLLDQDFSVWSFGGNLTQPIFQGGRIRASIDRSASLREQAAAKYHNVALQAFLEVEVTLAAETRLLHEFDQLQRASVEAGAAETLAWQRYRNGTLDFLNTLDAQRTANRARSTLLALRNQLLQNRVDLYLALGGPFQPAS